VPYLSASSVVIHYEEALYQVYAPLSLLPLFLGMLRVKSYENWLMYYRVIQKVGDVFEIVYNLNVLVN